MGRKHESWHLDSNKHQRFIYYSWQMQHVEFDVFQSFFCRPWLYAYAYERAEL